MVVAMEECPHYTQAIGTQHPGHLDQKRSLVNGPSGCQVVPTTMLIKTFVTPPNNVQMPGLLLAKLSAGPHPYIPISER